MVSPHPRRSLAGSAALLLSLTVQTCSAGSIAAWWTTLGPQVIMQNSTTNGIMYSDCNSNNTPIFDPNNPKYFKLSYQPRANTSVTGTGYYQTDGATATSFWYIDDNGDVVNSYQQCDPATGEFISAGSDQPITIGMPKPSNNSGLASMLLGAQAGYRIYYHDEDMNVQQVIYDPASQKFLYGGVVSKDQLSGNSLSASFTQYGNLSVIMPKANDIEVADLGSDALWWIESFPHVMYNNATNTTSRGDFIVDKLAPLNYTLPAWDGQATLGLAINKYETLDVFYIGTDRHLYQIYSWYGAWDFGSNQSATFWPLADEPNADFGIAWDETALTIRLYYLSNNTLTEVAFDNDGTWQDAAPVQTFNATAPLAPAGTTNGTSPSNPTTSPTTADLQQQGLSSGAKLGIGLGLSLGALAIVGGLVAFCCVRRSRRTARAGAAPAALENVQASLIPSEAATPPGAAGYADYPSYGSSPAQNEHLAYGSAVGGGGLAAWEKKMAMEQHPGTMPGQAAPLEMVEMAGTAPPVEMSGDSRPVYELPEQHYAHELVGEGHANEMLG